MVLMDKLSKWTTYLKKQRKPRYARILLSRSDQREIGFIVNCIFFYILRSPSGAKTKARKIGVKMFQ